MIRKTPFETDVSFEQDLHCARKLQHRNDLQSIRGVAILLVLIFHLMPSRFPLGYVGVDMFFVLSGFLMCNMLRDFADPLNERIKQFYLRRLRRIAPIYYVMLAVTFIATSFLLLTSDRAQVVRDLKWSLLFMSNLQPILEKIDYWDMVDSYRFFVHTWSLGVEMQFYLIAPFMYGVIKSPSIAALVHSIILLLSLVFQLVSSTAVGYGLLLSRIWQFNVGAIAALKIEERDETTQGYNTIEGGCKTANWKGEIFKLIIDVSFLSAVVGIIANSLPLQEKTARLLFTVLTGVVVYNGSSVLNQTRSLIVLGNWSYIIYLLHWPIIVAYKYCNAITSLDNTDVYFLLVIIFTISYISHVVLEKRIIASSYTACFALIAACLTLILINFITYDREVFLLQRHSIDSEDVENAILYNSRDVKIDPIVGSTLDPDIGNWTTVFKDELTLIRYLNNTGDLKVLMIGNSIAYNLQPLVYDILQSRIGVLRLFARSELEDTNIIHASPRMGDHSEIGCFNLPTIQEDERCRNHSLAARVVIEKSRPDITIFAAPWTFAESYENDTLKATQYAKELQEYISIVSRNSRAVIIEIPYYTTKIHVPKEILRRLNAKKSLDDLKVSKKISSLWLKRQKDIMLNLTCTNCIFSRTDEAVLEGDNYYFYNRKNLRSYTFDGFHFSSEGHELIRQHYTSLLKNVPEKIDQNKF